MADEAKSCGCYQRVNEKLRDHNTQITPTILLDSPYMSMPFPLATSQIETGRGKKKAVGLYASFCPFCGASMRKPKENAGG